MIVFAVVNLHHFVLSVCCNADAFILFIIYNVLPDTDEAPDSGDDSDDGENGAYPTLP